MERLMMKSMMILLIAIIVPGQVWADSRGLDFGGNQFAQALDSTEPSGKVLVLNGGNDALELSNTVLNSLMDITTEFWLMSTGSRDGIVSGAQSSRDNEYLIFGQDALAIEIKKVAWKTGVAVNDGEWHHIAIVRNGATGEVQLFVDGVLQGSKVLPSGALQIDSGGLFVGQEQDALGGRFDSSQAYEGLIDEFRIWNVMRSQEEIQATMGKSLSGSEQSLVVYYNFDRLDAEGMVPDLSGNSNHGKLRGDPKLVDATVLWASSVAQYSTQYGTSKWAATQALGPPDTYPNYGDKSTAWAPRSSDDQREFLELSYNSPIAIEGVDIYETYNPGAVDTVQARDPDGNLHLLWSGTAQSLPAASRIFQVRFLSTAFLVKGIRLSLDSQAVPGWNEIDAVGIIPGSESDRLKISAHPETILTDGSEKSTLRVQVIDSQRDLQTNDNSTQVTFSIISGNGVLSETQVIVKGGIAETVLTSSVVGAVTIQADADSLKPVEITVVVEHPPITWGDGIQRISFMSNREDATTTGIHVIDADGSNERLLISGVSGGGAYSPGYGGGWPYSWSPDGEQIAFSENRGGASNIYVTDRNGGNEIQLTQPVGDVTRYVRPAWSPDGKQIAFIGNARGINVYPVYVMQADGSRIQLVAGGWNEYGSWSADGREIFYEDRYARRGLARNWVRLRVTSIDGGDDRLLDLGPNNTMHPAMAPDGSRLAFVADEFGNDAQFEDTKKDYEIFTFVVNEGTSSIVQLTSNKYNDVLPAWSPGGSKVAFSSNRDGDYEIYVMDADGSNAIQLTDNDYDDFAPAWVPSASVAGTEGALTLSAQPDTIVADGTEVSTLRVQILDSERNPKSNDNSTKITFTVVEGEGTLSSAEMIVQDGVAETNLTSGMSGTVKVEAAADGFGTAETIVVFKTAPASEGIGRISFVSKIDDVANIYVTDADGRNERLLVGDIYTAGGPGWISGIWYDWPYSWSPDGTTLAFSADRGNGLQIQTTDSNGNNESELTHSAGDLITYAIPSYSPDGKQIAFIGGKSRGSVVGLVNADGTRAQITSSVSPRSISWLPDGGGLLVVRQVWSDLGLGANWLGIRLMSMGGSDEADLDYGPSHNAHPVMSSDGSLIAFAADLVGEDAQWEDRNRDFEIFLLKVDKNDPGVIQLTSNIYNDIFPMWSPDNERIAFSSNRDGDYEIYVMDRDGSNLIQVTFNDYDDFAPAWVPPKLGPIALDLDPESGDQEQRQTTSAPKVGDQVTVDIVAISGAEGQVAYQVEMTYDPEQLEWVGFEAKDVFGTGFAIPPQPSDGKVKVSVAIMGGKASKDSGSIGHATFKVLEGFSGETWVQLMYASYESEVDVGSKGAVVVIGGVPSEPEMPSPDFDGNGEVGFSDFIQFARVFGAKEGYRL